jgi:hypothetical protein
VRFHVVPGTGPQEPGHVTLTIDEKEVLASTSLEFHAPAAGRPAGKIQILTFTTCVIDDLVVSGRISKELRDWLQREREVQPRSTGGATPR